MNQHDPPSATCSLKDLEASQGSDSMGRVENLKADLTPLIYPSGLDSQRR